MDQIARRRPKPRTHWRCKLFGHRWGTPKTATGRCRWCGRIGPL